MVDLNLDELDATASESKATYAEIKAYVWEHHALKVSSLYISQVKRKCGLEVGKNYNVSAVSARKGTRHHGGVTMVSNDTIAIGKMMLLLSTANNPDSLIG